MDSSKKFVNPSPEIKANVLSKIFFCWILPFFKYGYNRDLEVKDIYNVVNDDKAGPLGDLLEKAWKNEQERAKRDNRQPSLKRAIYCAFWKSYAIYGVFMFIEAIVLKSLLPLVLAQYIAYFEKTDKIYDMGLWQLNRQEAGWILGTLVIFLTFSYVVIIHYAYLSCRRIGIRIRVACCSVIYRKMLKLSHASLGKTAAGQLVNLLSNDVERFETVARWLHYLWIMPISFVVSFYIMTDSVGLASIAAMVVIAVQAIPFQGYLSKLQGRFRLKIAQKTDYRVKLMSEIVSGIQVIKMYAWEKPFEKLVELSRRYDEVVEVCALEKDFKQFPYADKTMVGERGVSLSGGQRARINLARAVYTEADIYLFDDPLSAVDTHVSKHLFEKCIKNYLCKKTRILVTHQLQYLKEADMIIFLNNGKIEKIGTFSELSECVLKNFQRQESKNDNEKSEQEKYQRERIKSIVSIASSGKEIEEEEPEETEELLEKGSLSSALYLEYFKSGSGMSFILFLVILSFVSQAFCNFCDLWVTHWTNIEKIRLSYIDSFININQSLVDDNETTEITTTTEGLPFSITNQSNTFDAKEDFPKPESYAIIYTIFIVGSIVLSTARAIVFYKICMNSSKGLHNRMFANVLKAPMRFFDTNPSGRILNRFSKDIGAVDEILPNAMYDVVQVFLVMGGILALNFIVTLWMIIPAVVLGSLFYYLRVVYLSTAQNVKRLEGVTRAPVFSHISATLYGMPTIRSSNAQDMVTEEFDSLQDQHTGSSYLFQACSEAFGFYLDCISTAFLALVTYQFLIGDGNANSAEVGLVISSTLILTGMLQVGVRQSAEVASNMTSVERLVQYVKLKTEDDLRKPPTKKPADWPSKGKIVFANTYLRYALEELPVLKDLNILIEPGEKVGIVGRTGAGKSTLIASLFRLAPIEGTIAIDDVDTSDISLEQLRSNISIIPQEPILFSSTVRYNLDPFDKASDGDVWQALADVELKNSIESLSQQVSEGGSNFSAGQRQLICLARAILRNNKILVMDEATANVDPNTDSLIQKAIREKFKSCTVLTIAHRLNTIMDSDKVLVMDAGVAVEYAPPHELLQNYEGYFTKMVEQTGTQMATHLREEAFKAYQKTVAES